VKNLFLNRFQFMARPQSRGLGLKTAVEPMAQQACGWPNDPSRAPGSAMRSRTRGSGRRLRVKVEPAGVWVEGARGDVGRCWLGGNDLFRRRGSRGRRSARDRRGTGAGLAWDRRGAEVGPAWNRRGRGAGCGRRAVTFAGGWFHGSSFIEAWSGRRANLLHSTTTPHRRPT
jgi:hypothetical protein